MYSIGNGIGSCDVLTRGLAAVTDHIMPSVPLPNVLLPSTKECNTSQKNSYIVSNKISVGGFKHSSRNLKRVAQMPAKDRKEIMKILNKQARERRARWLSYSIKSKGDARSKGSNTLSDTSTSSVNKEWENWMCLQGNDKATFEDVRGIGDLIGVKYKGNSSNNFNVLTKEGRRTLRAEVGRILSKGESGGSGGGC